MIGEDLLFPSTVPYFRGLPSEELARIRRRCRQRDLTAGEIIVLEGQRAEALYVVCRGRVQVLRTSEEGKEQVLFVHGPGAPSMMSRCSMAAPSWPPRGRSGRAPVSTLCRHRS